MLLLVVTTVDTDVGLEIVKGLACVGFGTTVYFNIPWFLA